VKKYIAFLRAINVGGHTVKMGVLRQLFEAQGLQRVETFIASGNLIFEAASTDAKALEQQIEARLKADLGYEVATFLRTQAELAQIASYQPFPQPELDASQAFNIAFLADSPDEAAIQKLLALETEIDKFHVQGREVYWLCRKKQSESTFSNAVLEKTLKRQSTLRGVNTVRKLAEKYA
jgi:uncharacterized protein (DUF1697 family)